MPADGVCTEGDTAASGTLARGARALRQRPVAAMLVFCITLLAVIWSGIVVQLRAERENALERAARQTAGFARVFEEHVLRTLRAADMALRQVESEYRQQGTRLDLARFTREHRTLLDPFTALSVTDARGNLILASYPFAPQSYAEHESFRAHAARSGDQLIVGKPEPDAVSGTTSLHVSRRFDGPDGAFGGVVAVHVEPRHFSGFHDQIDLGDDAVVVLIGLDGVVRARKVDGDATVGQDLSGFDTFRDMRQRRAGTFTATRGLDGVRRVFSSRTMSAYPLIVQVGVSEAVTLAPYVRLRSQFLAWAVILTAVVGLFAALVSAQAARQARIGNALRASEARYRSFITATSRIVWSADAAGSVVADSPTWRTYTGQTYEQYRGAGWLDSIAHDDRPRVAASWAQAIAAGRACETEYRLRGIDGAYRTFRCRAVPVPNADGSVREWVAALEDLSEMKQAEAALRESSARLRAMLDAEPECVQLLDTECRIIEMNPAGLAMSEVGALDEIPDASMMALVSAAYRTPFREMAARVFAGEPCELAFELVGMRGTRRWLETRAVPLRDAHDTQRIVALLGVARDITAQKRARDALIASRKLQQDILNSLYAFVGLFSLDGTLVGANEPPFAGAGGRGEAIGKLFWDTYWWSHSVAAKSRLHDAMARAARGETVRYDEVARVEEDRYITVDIQFGPLRDAAGSVVQIVAFGVDITERKKAETARAHLARIVEASDDAILSRSLDHRIVSWNVGAERLFGYTAAEVTGSDLSLLVAPDYRERYLRLREMSSRGRPPPQHENVCIAKDGRRIDVWVSASPVHDEMGELVAVSLIMRDITEQRKHEAQQRLAASVLESAAEGIMITDRDKNILSVNRAFTEITGFTADDVSRKDHRLLSSAAHPASSYDHVWRVVSETGRWRGEVWDRRKSGEPYCELLSITAVHDDQGAIVHHCAILMDVTPQKAAEAELRRLNAELEDRVAARTRQLEAANKELAAFSYSVSHDLRAPLRAIAGFSAMILTKSRDAVDAETLSRLQRIQDNAERMGRLIDDLLKLSRVSQREIERRDFDLSALAGDVVGNLRRLNGHRALDVVVRPGMVTNGDPALVRLVLDNLIGNAWKFTGRTPRPRIEVGVQDIEGRSAYYVSDNGAGFDMQYADKLFNAFQRLHHRDEFDGTGIGLSIVHRVVSKHGGRVWVQAAVGQGATFYFTLS